MKASELMIGDWVTFKDAVEDNNILPVKIVGIGYQYEGDEDECLVQIGGSKSCDIITIDDEIVGIPLTAEILEKNGFRNIGGHWYDDAADYYELEIEAYSDSIWRVIYHNTEFNIGDERVFVGHIHELQHALRLCGIEKEVEL